MILILLWILFGIYALGWTLAYVFLLLCDPHNKLFYMGLALLWPVYVFDLIRMKAWK